MSATSFVSRLGSFVLDRWIPGTGGFVPLINPTTEDVVAETSTEGLDFRAVLHYARTVGGAGLRQLTFAERGRRLAVLAKAIHAERDALIELGILNGGNTRGDAKFDLDGATGTLQFYAQLGERLGDRKIVLDGELEALLRNPRFAGGHAWVPREGVAVHVNAFNFPAWGMMEKAAVALLAGMPVVTKPATSTALMAHRIVELAVQSGALPAGALQFICGGVGDLLEHLEGQDVLAFTGSSDTGAKLRGGRAAIAQSVRINVEADSLNSAILAPDVEPGEPTWELFLREVQTDVTQKAGQKCTAIRRVFVPEARLEAVIEDLRAMVSAVKVGNPALKEVRCGPLATASQLRDVRAGIERLRGCAEVLTGGGERGALVDVAEGRGYFVAPTLLLARDPGADAVHAHEVFGPVATLLPYAGGADTVLPHVKRGGGGLVSSLYTDDKDTATDVLLNLASHHGRLHLGSARIAEHSPGPGTVLPNLIHGGPGRAGGGEELGGERGLHFYLQRTAFQGERTLLEKVLGVSA